MIESSGPAEEGSVLPARYRRLWRALLRRVPPRAWFRRHLGRAAARVIALFGAAQTGFESLWRALLRHVPSRAWFRGHLGRAAARVIALFGAAQTGFENLWRALLRHVPPRAWFRRHLGWLSVTVGVIALFGAAQTSLGQRALGSAGIARTDPSYLELYFLHPTQLRSRLDQDQNTVLRFVVRSELSHSQRVGWYVLVTSTAGRREVGRGHLEVAPGAAGTVAAHLHVSCDGGSRVQLLVALEHSRARIDQWLTCLPPGG